MGVTIKKSFLKDKAGRKRNKKSKVLFDSYTKINFGQKQVGDGVKSPHKQQA